jgi:hypothetical protein
MRVRRATAARRASAGLLAVLMLGTSAAGCVARQSRPDLADRAGRRGDDLVRHASAVCRTLRPEQPDYGFTSDGCSLWPDGTWDTCCVEHDVAYWCGGSPAARLRADAVLNACVQTDGRRSHHLGELMYWGVRAGGVPWQPSPWRWGYGFAGVRGYDPRP